MLLGTCKTIMTPALGTWLAGYENGRGGDSVLDELQLRTFWFQPETDSSAREAVCMITAELLGFGEIVTNAVRSDLSEKFGLSPDAIMLSASHTHCGPQTCENMPNNGGPLVPEVIDQLRQRIIDSVETARTSLQPTELRVARGECSGYAISRRLIVDGEALFAPSPDGPRDDEVSVIVCSTPGTQELQAVLFHYTCHPTMLNNAAFSGDYPGAALRRVEQNLEGVCAAFLPGCFGDVRPRILTEDGTKFCAATYADVEKFGNALGDEVVRAVQQGLSSPALHSHVSYAASVLSLPLQDNPEKIPLTLQRIQLADELSLIAMGGEMGVDYGHWIKALSPQETIIPVGYSNGLIGYVCPEHQYKEGGFEPYLSCEAYNLPAPFVANSEGLVHDAIRELIR